MPDNKKPTGKKDDGLEKLLATDGRPVPNEKNINFDSYMDSIPDEMKAMFTKMRQLEKEETAKAEKELGIDEAKKAAVDDNPGYQEVVMDAEYLRKQRIKNAQEEADRLENKDTEFDEALEAEKERLKELEEHPELDPNAGAVQHVTKDGIKESEKEKDPEEGEILGDLYAEPNKARESEEEDYDDLKTDEFLPDFEDDEDEKKPKEEAQADEDDDIDEDTPELEIRYREEERLEKIIRETPEVSLEADTSPVIHVSQKKTEVIEVPGNNSDRVKELSDDAFLTRLTKIRRKNFRVVEVPLLNSGFVVSMNGISPGDLVALYNIVEQHANGGISAIDYLNAQMKTIAKAIVKIHPHFDKSNLHYMIHYADLNLLMYAVVAATLEDAKYPIDACEGCGKAFRITVPSTDIILNKDDIKDRAEQIYNATDVKQTSLLEKNVIMRFPSEFEVVLGHASIGDQRALMQSIDRYSDNASLTEVDKMALLECATTELPWIKSIVGPGGIKARGPYQTTKLLGMMENDERRQIIENIRMMQKDLIPIKLGVRNVKCPHCGHVHSEIQISSLAALVFFNHRAESSQFAQKND